MDRNWYVDEIEITAGGYSSIHCHKFNQNTFYVREGSVVIEQFKPDSLAIGTCRTLTMGMTYTVIPGKFHRFYCPEDAVVQEFYSNFKSREISADDIIRQEGFGNGFIRSNVLYSHDYVDFRNNNPALYPRWEALTTS